MVIIIPVMTHSFKNSNLRTSCLPQFRPLHHREKGKELEIALKQQSESPKLTDYIRASGCKERRQEGPVLRISFHLGQPGVAHMHRHSVLLLWLLLGGEPPLMPLPQLQPRPQQGTSCQEHQLTHSQLLRNHRL